MAQVITPRRIMPFQHMGVCVCVCVCVCVSFKGTLNKCTICRKQTLLTDSFWHEPSVRWGAPHWQDNEPDFCLLFNTSMGLL